MRKRGEFDNIPELMKFADKLEKATLDTIESGVMTKDLVAISDINDIQVKNTEDFIKAVAERLKTQL